MCFVDLEKAVDRVPRKVLEYAMRKKVIAQVLIRSVMSLYEGAKTRFRVDYELSEEFEAKFGMHRGSEPSYFSSAVAVDVVTELAREGGLIELLNVAGLVLMSETMEGIRNKLKEWKGDKGLKNKTTTSESNNW